jgi:hypothetical protein
MRRKNFNRIAEVKMRAKSVMIASTALLITAEASAQPQATPPANPGLGPAPAIGQPDPQASVNDILNPSLGSINECYRGVHSYFNDDVVGRAIHWGMKKIFVTAAEPGGLCDQYAKAAPNFPVDVSVPLVPGISIPLDKLCKALQNPKCPY